MSIKRGLFIAIGTPDGVSNIPGNGVASPTNPNPGNPVPSVSGYLYAGTANGNVVIIDPSTQKATKTVLVDSNGIDALMYDGTDIWAFSYNSTASTTTIYQLDKTTLAVKNSNTVSMSVKSYANNIMYDGTFFFVEDTNDHLHKIDRTNIVIDASNTTEYFWGITYTGKLYSSYNTTQPAFHAVQLSSADLSIQADTNLGTTYSIEGNQVMDYDGTYLYALSCLLASSLAGTFLKISLNPVAVVASQTITDANMNNWMDSAFNGTNMVVVTGDSTATAGYLYVLNSDLTNKSSLALNFTAGRIIYDGTYYYVTGSGSLYSAESAELAIIDPTSLSIKKQFQPDGSNVLSMTTSVSLKYAASWDFPL